MITVQKASVYPEGNRSRRPILREIDYTFQPGEITLVIGRTGSGKTTLLQVMAGLSPADEGTVLYGGVPLWKGGRMNKETRGAISLAFQYPERQLFAESLRKEFRYTLQPLRLKPSETGRRTAQAMEAMKLPGALLDESVLTLSGGLQRRAALAVTLSARPEWLLLDEPTAGIDPSGIPPLLEAVQAHARSGGGVVIASHDLDTFFPVADRVLVMDGGALTGDRTPEAWCAAPEGLLQARIGLPSAVRLRLELQRHGIPWDDTGSLLRPEAAAEALRGQTGQQDGGAGGPHAEGREAAGEVQQRPAAAAEALRGQAKQQGGGAGGPHAEGREAAAVRPAEGASGSTAVPEAAGSPAAEAPGPAGGTPAPEEEGTSAVPAWIRGLNPLAPWGAYLCVSTGMLLQDRWLGAALAAVLLAGSLLASRVTARELLKPLRPFLLFVVFSALLSGLQWHPSIPDGAWWTGVSFSLSAAAATFRQLLVLWLVMGLSLLFSRLLGQRGMRQGVEQALSVLARWRIPVGVISLYTALLLRMLPELAAEMGRMSVIIRARGGGQVKPGSVRIRDLPAFLVPLLLSMMKHAEDLSLALESRGCRLTARLPRLRKRQPFGLPDRLLLFGGAAVLVLLVWVDSMAR